MFSTIFSLCFVFFGILFMLPGILKARKRHWSEALVRIVLTLISGVITFVLTSIFVPMITEAILEPITSSLNGSDLEGLLTELPSAKDALLLVMSLVVTPVFFLVVFVILKFILLVSFSRLLAKLSLKIAGKIAKKDFVGNNFDKKKPKKFSPLSAALGALCGFLGFFILLIPIVETTLTVAVVGKTVASKGVFYEVSDGFQNNVATYVVHPVGAPVWAGLTRDAESGDKIYIEKEALFITSFVTGLSEISSGNQATVRKSAETFRSTGALIEKTTFVPRFCAEFINAANGHWNKGEDFAGISRPKLSMGNSDIMETFLDCLNNSTTETMKVDLAVMMNVLAVIAENAKLDDGAIDMSSILEDKAIISKFSVELLQSPRLAPAMNTFVKNQMEASNSYIELPDQDSEEYKELVSNIGSRYMAAIKGSAMNEDTLDNLATAVGEALAENGVELEEHEHVAIASTLYAEFGDTDNLTDEEVAEFIEQYRRENPDLGVEA